MRKLALSFAAVLAVLLLVASGALADRDAIVRFATLPAGHPGNPEGIAADPSGNIYAASFDFSGVNDIYVFAPSGRLVDTISLTGHVPLGMQWGPDGKLYVADFGNGAVLQLAPPSHAITRTFPICTGAGSTCGLNAITFDGGGGLYVSDSFGGRIFRLDILSGGVTTYKQDEQLTPGPHGFPPFGANGIAFDAAGFLYVANTADDRVLKIAPGGGAVTTVIDSINGADGLNFDPSGRLWVCANQENTLYVVDVTKTDPNGHARVVDIRGSFDGVGPDGAARGLLFPASIVFADGNAYVTNTALGFRHFFVDEPQNGPSVFTLSRVPLAGHGSGER